MDHCRWIGPFLSLGPLLLCSTPALASTQRGDSVTAHDIATLTDIDGLALSHDGKLAAVQTRRADPARNLYDIAWQVISVDGRVQPTRIAGGGDPIIDEVFGKRTGAILTAKPKWSPDDRWISFIRRDGDSVQVWRGRVGDDGEAEQVTRTTDSVADFAYSVDGQRLFFRTEIGRHTIDRLLAEEGKRGFKYDDRFDPIYSTIPTWPASADVPPSDSPSTNNVWVHDFKTKDERLATPAEVEQFSSLTATDSAECSEAGAHFMIMASNGSCAWLRSADSSRPGPFGPQRIVARRRTGNLVQKCVAKECESRWFKGVIWRNGEEVLFLQGTGPRSSVSKLYSWKPGGSPKLLAQVSGLLELSRIGGCEISGDELICPYEESARPVRLIALSLSNGQIRTVYEPNTSFTKKWHGSIERIDFTTSSGIPGSGFLVLSDRTRPQRRLPLIIVTYRCSGFLRGGVGDEYPIYAFAEQGFAVFCYDTPDADFEALQTEDWLSYALRMRGPGDLEKRDVQEGLETVVADLVGRGLVDPEKIGLTGLSFGAETVMYALFNMRKLKTAIASGQEFAPSSTFLYGNNARSLMAGMGLGSPVSDRWNVLSVGRNAVKVQAPLLLNVADHEMVGVMEQYYALKDAGRNVEMNVFPDEYHIKWQPVHRLAIYNRNIDWMNFWLLGKQATDSTKALQYENWRGMRDRGLKDTASLNGNDPR